MASPFVVKNKEFGRGPAEVERFSTLAGAAKYIKARWQGAEYIDGEAGFHTDYCRYTLEGFTLKDIGTFSYPVEFGHVYREYDFNPDLIEQGNALCDACCKRPAKWEANRRHGRDGEKARICTQCGHKAKITYPYGKAQFDEAVRQGYIVPFTYTPPPPPEPSPVPWENAAHDLEPALDYREDRPEPEIPF